MVIELANPWTTQTKCNFRAGTRRNHGANNESYFLTKFVVSLLSMTDKGLDNDWREFRAQLVRSEKRTGEETTTSKKTNDDQWAYETGDFVERGSIVISVPSSNEILNDIDALNNVCYRKSIVLVLDVGPNFMQGIVLNRPTNIGVKDGMQFVQPGHGELYDNEMGFCLGDNCDMEEKDKPVQSARWKVWFGGEIGGPYSDNPQVMCLHSLMIDSAIDISNAVLPGIFVTSFDNAQNLVKAGEANPSDFWLFCGIFGWETSTFYREMHEEGLWHIVSTDSETILEELNMLRCEEDEEIAMAQNCDVDHDPRNAGLNTWSMLMEKIGLEPEANRSEDSFGDLMLHEWATGTLAFSVREEQSSMIMSPSLSDPMFVDGSDFDLSGYDPASVMPLEGDSGITGVMVRASSAKRSPFLLSDQCFHKSVILVLRDDGNSSEGIILNHVTDRTYRLDLDGRTIDIPIRYGGPAYYSVEDGDYDDDNDDFEYGTPTLFLHSSKSLRKAGIGIPIGKSNIYRCTQEEVITVLESSLANAQEIFVVQGSSIWTKTGNHSGVIGDVDSGFFELVPRPYVQEMWNILLRQSLLSYETLSLNMILSQQAWEVSHKNANDDKSAIKVFGTDIDVAMLADEASLRWVKVNLLSIQ
jgi:putative AlgH/UPF0301 family transcriptional regulator